jgi:hypothetical protein
VFSFQEYSVEYKAYKLERIKDINGRKIAETEESEQLFVLDFCCLLI